MSGSPTACAALKEKLNQHSREQSECTIYRVHRELRDVNPEVYEPKVAAIGPYHRSKEHLKIMEVHKLRILQSLIERKGSDVEMYVSAVGELESKARKCYADQPIGLDPSGFIEMLVLDGCFIVELVLNFVGEKNDPIFKMEWMKISLMKDLMLFENQIPFFILCKLFDLINDPEQGVTLPSLLMIFFSELYPKAMEVVATRENEENEEIKHILGLIHRRWFHGFDPNPDLDGRRTGKLEVIDCALELTKANVKFQKDKEATLFDIRFEDGVMHMAPLAIYDRTEIIWRNLIAYEQYSGNDHPNLVTDYVIFLDNLINSAKDVGVLKEHEIITNMQGDDEVVAKMVNKLCESVISPSDRFFYGEICKKVKEHCKKRRNRWLAKLRRNYLNSPWAIISVIAAVVLLLLTVTQTVFSIV